jgi:hypothetical protein
VSTLTLTGNGAVTVGYNPDAAAPQRNFGLVQ